VGAQRHFVGPHSKPFEEGGSESEGIIFYLRKGSAHTLRVGVEVWDTRHNVTDGVFDRVVGPGVFDGLAPFEIDADPVLDGVNVGEAVVVGDGVG